MSLIDENNRVISPLNFPNGRNVGGDPLTKQNEGNYGLAPQNLVMIRQRMDESNHDMVHIMSQQIVTILRRMIEKCSYEPRKNESNIRKNG